MQSDKDITPKPKIIAYDRYTDVRGDAAKPISVAMGIDEPSEFIKTGYLVEIRTASDHIRLSAHATTYSKEVLLFNSHSLDVIELDTVKKEALKTVYDGNSGNIITLKAPWSFAANGYTGDYVEVEKLNNQKNAIAQEWEKYDEILKEAEIFAR